MREAIEAAWARAIDAGALPAIPDDAASPVGRGRAAGEGRARRPRDEPRDEARPAAAPPAARDRRGHRRRRSAATTRHAGGGPIASAAVAAARVHQPPPRRRRARGDRRRDPRVARDVGPGRADPAAERQRRVRLGQPDRAADDRQRARRVRRRPALPGPRGRRPDGHARVLLQRLGRPGRQPRARRSWRCGEASRSPRTATTAPTSTTSRPRSPTTSGRRRRAEGADAGAVVGHWAAGPGPGRDRGEPRAARRPLRRLEERGLAPRRGLGRAGDRAPAGGRPPLRAGRRAVVPLDRVRRRQGPGRDPLERRADLLRGRHRLRDREVQPRLRPPDLHLGRRPPRDGGPAPERRRGDGLRPRRGPGPALRLGPVHPRRRRGLDVEAGRRVRHARRAARGGRRRRRPLVLRVTRRDDRDRLRHRAREEAVGREPGLLRPVRPRPDRVDPAQGRRVGLDAGVDGRGPARRRARGRASPGSSPGSRRSSRTRSGPRRRTASPPTRRSWRRSSTRSTATRGSSTRTSRSCPPGGWRSSSAAKTTLANALGLLGISAPEPM